MSYDWVTDEMFDNKLQEIAEEHGVAWLLALSGVYEIASEELNNDVLEALEQEREGETDDE